ncbi:MAG: hypothetical protein JW939_03185 [Candidatus Thermoplasmatota archaeon]|nr:hypothetical protein [Candidatus Thermoplasmatota archaeon]
MGQQINLRLPDKLFNTAVDYSESHGYSSIQEFIKEVLREKLFEKEDITREELDLVKMLVKASEEKGLYGTEKDLFDRL